MYGWRSDEADKEPEHESLEELKRNARDQGQEPSKKQAVHDQAAVERPSGAPQSSEIHSEDSGQGHVQTEQQEQRTAHQVEVKCD